MTILVVDNDARCLRDLTEGLQTVCPGSTVVSYIDPLMAGKFSFSHPVDLLFARRRMKRMDGAAMGRFVRRTSPWVKVHLIGGPDETAEGALSWPVSTEQLRQAVAEAARAGRTAPVRREEEREETR